MAMLACILGFFSFIRFICHDGNLNNAEVSGPLENS
jgi:hypothetical protein